ncbi:hypothetical protein OVA24_09265 [Luteolibacter sp. SL250]|uniref:hypothetical protein n=1 Tax=Luteolibacter sp. SL250 TaxID=2995170 RepID=UPI00226FAD72|nr:hypothetical protein [Luteolibacter sp. SL250]WAC21572.1 hypothetical protein OVA24_09265 [Luteolibacter sp. SL250]
MQPPGSITSYILSLCLIAAGGSMCTSMAKSLTADKELKAPVNPFGINSSPYGEVLAMAMQGTIDTYWHSGVEQATHGSDDHGTPHVHTADCGHDITPPIPATGLRGGMTSLLDELAEASEARTNPKPASRAQTFNTRREIEDKLRFAYKLDPAHYANYNTYHFFLTEPELGTRPKLTPQAAGLADKTIRYCLARTDDPRPALTAAAAAGNLLELMFNDRTAGNARYSTSVMREYLHLMDQCIERHRLISGQWAAAGQWDLLSPMRRMEAQDRLSFTLKVRNASEQTITRLEQQEQPVAPSAPTPPSAN